MLSKVRLSGGELTRIHAVAQVGVLHRRAAADWRFHPECLQQSGSQLAIRPALLVAANPRTGSLVAVTPCFRDAAGTAPADLGNSGDRNLGNAVAPVVRESAIAFRPISGRG